MKKYKVICDYCGHNWISDDWVKPKFCQKCQDKKLRYKEHKTGNVFGYDEEKKPEPLYYDGGD